MIDAVLNSTDTLSPSISGSKITNYSRKAANTVLTAQVIRVPSSGSYSVELQAGAVSPSGEVIFGKIGEFAQGKDREPSTFFISLGCQYRFEHQSGVEVKVRLTA